MNCESVTGIPVGLDAALDKSSHNNKYDTVADGATFEVLMRYVNAHRSCCVLRTPALLNRCVSHLNRAGLTHNAVNCGNVALFNLAALISDVFARTDMIDSVRSAAGKAMVVLLACPRCAEQLLQAHCISGFVQWLEGIMVIDVRDNDAFVRFHRHIFVHLRGLSDSLVTLSATIDKSHSTYKAVVNALVAAGMVDVLKRAAAVEAVYLARWTVNGV